MTASQILVLWALFLLGGQVVLTLVVHYRVQFRRADRYWWMRVFVGWCLAISAFIGSAFAGATGDSLRSVIATVTTMGTSVLLVFIFWKVGDWLSPKVYLLLFYMIVWRDEIR